MSMKNVDVDVYLTNLINFFEKNPNDLIDLIGELKKTIFYDKLREKSYENFEKGEEYIITQKQLVDIVVGMYDDVTSKGVKIEVKVPIIQTSYGTIWLN